MDSATRRVLCENCKVEYDEFEMTKYNTGRRSIYLCPECVKNGQIAVTGHEIVQVARKRKAWHV